MANPVHLLLRLVLLVSVIHASSQLEPSQSHSLLLIHQLLNFPFTLTTDFCDSEPTPSLTLLCYQNNITQLHITGNNSGLGPGLPSDFASHTLFATLATLPTLKVLSLVSLGLRGPLPSTIAQLSSLEILNLSSNSFSGSIPPEISSLRNLQTLILDHNNFTAQVPDSLTSLPLLAVLSLNNNSLTGSLPKPINFMENLRILSVSNNHLSGEVAGLHNLTNLQVLDLSDNCLGPHFPSLHTNLVALVLRNNSFELGIPSDLVSFYQLERLDLSMNGFVGPFLPSFLSLPSVRYINISHNKFTGRLFQNMSCNADIEHIDLSSNLLSGELPSCLVKLSSNNNKAVVYGNNCLSNHEQSQHPYNMCSNQALAVKPHDDDLDEYNNNSNRPHGKAIFASATIGGTIGGVGILGLVFFVVKRLHTKITAQKPQSRLILEKVSSVNTVKLLSDARYISQTMKLGAMLPAYKTFTLEELKEATDNFDHSNLLADPSHSEIYRGKLGDGSIVAIRRLRVKKKQHQQSLTYQIELVSKLRHRHLVSALGHCFDGCLDDPTITIIFLVSEFVPNGSLRDYARGKKMSWKQRIGAAIEVAKGIQFLHTIPALYCNNLKITDVLLDHDLHVKLNCHNHLPLLAETRATVGAIGSVPGPKQNILKREKEEQKKDEYDLGVILAEIIVGRPIVSDEEVAVVKDLLQVSITVDDAARKSIVDPWISKECGDNSLLTVMEICIRCLSDEASDRPSIEDILWNLHFAAQNHESYKNDQYSCVSSLP